MKLKILFIILVFALFGTGAFAKPIIAFGYMDNITNNREFNYLEYIFPNSFANSVNAVFDVQVKKPLDLEKELGEQKKILKKSYEYYELPDFIKDIRSDIFVFGSFKPLWNNQIKIILNIYIKGYSEIFTFSNTGRMETQVSKLMDRISIIIINFMSEQNLYKVKKIQPGTALSILTNLEGEEQNKLLIAFMKKAYRVLYFQNNSIHNMVDNDSIQKFSYIRTTKNSYDVIIDWRKAVLNYGTWTTEYNKERTGYIKNLYNKYDLEYEVVKDNALDRINYAFDNKIDVMLVIGFSGNRKSAWVRAIDMKEKELIWMQSNIESDSSASDPVTGTAKKIMENMMIEPKDPYNKSEVPAKEK